MKILLLSLTLITTAVVGSPKDSRPNIVLLALDDVGWADVGYHGSNFPTPNIDALAASGVKLDRMYAMPQCSPTRSSLLTGRYAFKIGMQHFTTIFPGSAAGIPFDTPTLAEVLSNASYDTHMVGKWHLGYSSWAHTPTGRGFDSFLGYLQGQTDYYNRTMPSCGTGVCIYKSNKGDRGIPQGQGSQGEGYDFWDNKRSAIEQFGEYTSDAYMNRVDQIISNSAQSPNPLFLYYAEQQLHIPLESPPGRKYLGACKGVTGGSASINRTVLCSMATKLDESVGRLVSSLKKEGLWDNTLIWAVSDNGGMTHWGDTFPASASSNWPLRGGKATVFEGGVRAVSFLAGGFLPKTAPSSYGSMLHVSDVLSTIAPLADASLPSEVSLDGINAWPSIMGDQSAPKRTEIPLNIDTNPMSATGGSPIIRHHTDGTANFSALISWPWKLIVGVTCNPGVLDADKLMDGWWTIHNYSRILAPVKSSSSDVLLFNLQKDESEHFDVSDHNPEIVSAMRARIQQYSSKQQGFRRSQLNLPLPLANPKYHNWTWAPFRPSIARSKFLHASKSFW